MVIPLPETCRRLSSSLVREDASCRPSALGAWDAAPEEGAVKKGWMREGPEARIMRNGTASGVPYLPPWAVSSKVRLCGLALLGLCQEGSYRTVRDKRRWGLQYRRGVEASFARLISECEALSKRHAGRRKAAQHNKTDGGRPAPRSPFGTPHCVRAVVSRRRECVATRAGWRRGVFACAQVAARR